MRDVPIEAVTEPAVDSRLAAQQIEALRKAADELTRMINPFGPEETIWYWRTQATAYSAAATLLEVHVATGISLENFGPVGDFVNDQLAKVGQPPFEPNGV